MILLIPLALLLPHFFGVMGVYYAEPVADLISVAIAFHAVPSEHPEDPFQRDAGEGDAYGISRQDTSCKSAKKVMRYAKKDTVFFCRIVII